MFKLVKVVFQNLKPSPLAREAVEQRIESVLERFPDLAGSEIRVTLSMENSPRHPGPDLFSVKFVTRAGKYGGVVFKRSASNLYDALTDLSEHLQNRLTRFRDRHRNRHLHQRRRWKPAYAV